MAKLAIIIGFVILGYLIYRSMKQEKQLTSEGKIIDRDRKFMEQAEDFTLTCSDPGRVTGQVQQLPFSEMKVSMTAGAQGQSFQFAFDSVAGGWTAVLSRKDEPSGQLAYRFQFTHWKTRDGMIVGELYMNQLLTAVEKMFLSIDPNTKVQTVYLETKTRHKLF